MEACSISCSYWVKLYPTPVSAYLFQTFYSSYVTIPTINELFFLNFPISFLPPDSCTPGFFTHRVDIYLICSVSVRWHMVRFALEILFSDLGARRSFTVSPHHCVSMPQSSGKERILRCEWDGVEGYEKRQRKGKMARFRWVTAIYGVC